MLLSTLRLASAHMGRMAERYTEAQRQAVANAMIDGGMTAREAVGALKRGELNVPPVDMPTTSAQTYRKRETKRRANRKSYALAEKNPDEATSQARELALKIALKELGRLERKSRLNPPDITALERLARLVKGLERAPAKTVQTATGPKAVPDSDFMRRLRERHGADDDQP